MKPTINPNNPVVSWNQRPDNSANKAIRNARCPLLNVSLCVSFVMMIS